MHILSSLRSGKERAERVPTPATEQPRDISPPRRERQPGSGKGHSPNAAATAAIEEAAGIDAVLQKRYRPHAASFATSSTRTGAATAAAETVAVALELDAKQQELDALGVGVQTRRTACEAEARMREVREQLEAELKARRTLLSQREAELHKLLSNPLDAWEDDAFLQLAMCEFARDYDEAAAASDSGRVMGNAFRAKALWARRKDADEKVELPRLRGLYEMDQLRVVLICNERLRLELERQLRRFKALYCKMLSGFGRFKKVAPEPGESLLALFERTHVAARKWRPRGNPGKPDLLVPISKEGGVYTAEWRTQTYELYHLAAGKTLSLRGTRGVAIAGSKRYLASIAEEDHPAHESYGTIRLHDMQAHTIQRCKALEASFEHERCSYQWDEATNNHVPWVVQIQTSKRGVGDEREREVIGTTKLRCACSASPS